MLASMDWHPRHRPMRGRAQHGPSRRGGGGAQDSSGKKKKQHEHQALGEVRGDRRKSAVGISCSIVPCAQNPHMSDDQKPARRSKSSPERRSEADLARHSTATLRGGWSGPPARRATAETRARTQAACAPVSAKTPPLFHVAHLTWSELTFHGLVCGETLRTAIQSSKALLYKYHESAPGERVCLPTLRACVHA
ncbi:unnamed protein product [Prorocentrum cordatum]|uniref:Uncharacterized protein n=1 Tax=Prorocentrum cordatum TaxID=2364126 RepID=A0ABN9UNV4_9DINO|nr:unnamed protein product [Polarella glacialis]